MGFTPVNKITITRNFNPREIVVEWRDDVTGDHVKRFEFEDKDEAMKFATIKFNELAM